MKIQTRFLCAVLFLLLAVANLHPGAVGSESETPKVDPKAEKIVRRFADFIGGLQSFRVDVTNDMRMMAEGMDQTMDSQETLILKRPKQFAVIHKGGMMGGCSRT